MARSCTAVKSLSFPRAPSYLNSRLLGYVITGIIGYIEPRTHDLGNWRHGAYKGLDLRFGASEFRVAGASVALSGQQRMC